MARVVVFDEFGGPDVLHMMDESVQTPGPGEVRVKIEAAAVNPLDLMMRAGTSPAAVPLPHARLGVEASGVVDDVGRGVTGLEVGQPVIVSAVPNAAAVGMYADYALLAAQHVIPRPESMDAVTAAATWVGFSTAYGALVEKAGMRPGDRVLISAASGSVGRSAIQIANQLGAIPIALTREHAKREELLTAGAAAVVATDGTHLVESVRDVTGGGAEIVLDMVRGPGQQQLVAAAGPGATIVVAGFLDSRPTPFPIGVGLRIFTYASFEHTLDPGTVARMAAFLRAGVRLGAIEPAIGEVFPLEDVAEAHRRVESGTHGGKKIVLAL